MLETITVIIEDIKNGDCVDVSYIDFVKAFDIVSILKLIQKFKFYSLHENY